MFFPQFYTTHLTVVQLDAAPFVQVPKDAPVTHGQDAPPLGTLIPQPLPQRPHPTLKDLRRLPLDRVPLSLSRRPPLVPVDALVVRRRCRGVVPPAVTILPSSSIIIVVITKSTPIHIGKLLLQDRYGTTRFAHRVDALRQQRQRQDGNLLFPLLERRCHGQAVRFQTARQRRYDHQFDGCQPASSSSSLPSADDCRSCAASARACCRPADDNGASRTTLPLESSKVGAPHSCSGRLRIHSLETLVPWRRPYRSVVSSSSSTTGGGGTEGSSNTDASEHVLLLLISVE